MKSYSLITGIDQHNTHYAQHMLGRLIGRRVEDGQRLIVVVSNPELLPEFVRQQVGEPARSGLVFCHGVTSVMSHIDEMSKGLEDGEILHVVYWMDARTIGLDETYALSRGWLPLRINSDAVCRQVASDKIHKVTFFVE